MSPSATKPRSELPQPRPSEAYMYGPARGMKVPKMQRMAVRPATAEAAYWVVASMK
jgi:hypothetical protein